MDVNIQRFPSLVRDTRSERTLRYVPSSNLSTQSGSSLTRFPSLYSTTHSTVKTSTYAPSISCFDEAEEQTELERFPSLRRLPKSTLYEDVPLSGLDSIRLLKVHSGCGQAPLHCTLFETTILEREDRYTALSYTWDHGGQLQTIHINKKAFEVQENLYNFLHALRDASRAIVVWADAICINQGHPDEKNHQVQLMSRIYEDAACTQSWLGNDLPWLALEMKLASTAAALSDASTSYFPFDTDPEA